MSLHQGDQYNIIFKIEVCENPMNMENIELIEFTIGSISKNYPLEVEYDKENKTFLFPVTQEETFAFNGWENYQARIKYINGDVYGSPINRININKTLSRNII